MKWQAYCKTCNKLLVKCPNGGWATNVGHIHMKGNSIVSYWNESKVVAGGTVNCDVIVGYKVEL